MHRSRKSTFGCGKQGLAPPPVRVDMSYFQSQRKKSPLGAGRMTPSPTALRTTTPHLSTGRKPVAPIRASDLSPREASILFPQTKTPNVKSPKSALKTRRSLFPNKPEINGASSSSQQPVAPSKPAVRSLRKPSIIPEKSRIPKAPSVKKSKPVTKPQAVLSSTRRSVFRKPVTPANASNIPSRVPKPSTSGQTKEQANVLNDLRRVLQEQQESLQEHRNIIKEQRAILEEFKSWKTSVEEQRSMILEAKNAFAQILEEQRSVIEEQRKNLDEQKRALNETRTTDDHEFTAMEKAIAASSEFNVLKEGKENSEGCRKSEVEYRQMRRSLRFLGTPTLTCSSKKSKTPRRTSLSNKVRAQLHNLWDD